MKVRAITEKRKEAESMTKREKRTQWVTDRDRKRIAARLPILVPMQEGDTNYWVKNDGYIVLIRHPQISWVAVKRFDPATQVDSSKKRKAFEVIARLDAIQGGEEETETAIAGDAFRASVEGLFPSEFLSYIESGRTRNGAKWSATFLSAAGTVNLESARLVIWIPKVGTPGPAMFCPNDETASFVSLAFSKLFTGLRACLQCGRIFMPTRLDQDYHDRRCADLHRKRRKSTREKNGGTK